ncbi:MAG: methyltransferase domain-containing protein [Candidatus Marinimicrobia bacterium]|nr:methyltransferase domain-containing protein [Candidatus Neomarinimicrobiota bacterium]
MPTHQEIKENTRKQWNEFSGGWKKWDVLIMEALHIQGEELLKQVPVSISNVLDVATGTGEPGLTLAERFPNANVIGTDLSDGMLAVAEENAKKRGLKNYHTKSADACDLPFEDEVFDAVFCRLGIMFFPDPAQGAEEFLRVLKPGGRTALTVWNVPAKNEWLAIAGSTVSEKLHLPPPPPDAPGVFRFGEAGLLRKILEKSGFKKVKEREVRGVMKFESAGQYLDMMLEVAAPIVAALREAPETKQEEVKTAILSAAESMAESDGSLNLSWNAWLVTGEKQRVS